MSEYIKKDLLKLAVIEALEEPPFSEKKFERAGALINVIDKFPAADVVEVVHAHWQPYDACDPDENAYECSACGFVLQLMDGTPESNQYNGCPHCLARMDGDAHD